MMDLATIGAKELKKQGILKNLDESDEINACTVKIKCDVNGKDEDWLFLFKNETHNHPTEIEPFGGAATCIGGAIRDPLSGRSYVYQAMRVTGAGDPLVPVSETLPGKLPQRKLVTTAAAGYSSYGNQIGLATGQVDEIYHPGYVAKRMEIGAVVGATRLPMCAASARLPGCDRAAGRPHRPRRRGRCHRFLQGPQAGQPGALRCRGAEGQCPIERKLQRLFRREDACKMIKRCNDFGAGGVSVAIGELADGLYIDLNKVTKSTMVWTARSWPSARARSAWLWLLPRRTWTTSSPSPMKRTSRLPRGQGHRGKAPEHGVERCVHREHQPRVPELQRCREAPERPCGKATVWQPQWEGLTFSQKMKNMVGDLNVCSKKGLSERFDSTIGAATVLMPFGGAYQLTPRTPWWQSCLWTARPAPAPAWHGASTLPDERRPVQGRPSGRGGKRDQAGGHRLPL